MPFCILRSTKYPCPLALDEVRDFNKLATQAKTTENHN